MRKVTFFSIFANAFNVWLNKRQMNYHIHFLHSKCWCVLLVKVCEENPASHRYVVGKGRAFFRLLWMFFFIPHQKLTRGSVLKISCNVEFKMKFKNQWTFNTLCSHERIKMENAKCLSITMKIVFTLRTPWKGILT